MKKIAQIILAVAIVALVYVIYDQISTPIKFDDELKAKKAQVIDRIKDIRTAQRAFKSKYQRFTGSFDTLTNFILQDTLELERKIVDEDDSVAMAQLKKMGKKNVEKFKIAVIDTIFSPKRLSKQDVEQLRYIPGTDDKAQYIMEAGIITTESKVVIPIVECRAPYKMFLDTVAYRQEIINLIDDEVNNLGEDTVVHYQHIFPFIKRHVCFIRLYEVKFTFGSSVFCHCCMMLSPNHGSCEGIYAFVSFGYFPDISFLCR